MKILHCNKTRNTYIAEAQEKAAPKKLWIRGRKRNEYRKIPKITPSIYKLPKLIMQKTLR